VQAATNAISIYIKLHDDPNIANETAGVDGVTDAERKKAIKKAKKAAKKQEEQNNAHADAKDAKKDEDPKGESLVKTDKPLEEAVKFLKPLQELSPSLLQTQLLAFEVHVRRGISYANTILIAGKYFQALAALNAAKKLKGANEVSARVKLLKEKLVGVELKDELKSIMEESLKMLEPVQNGI
jgi:N-alpha-acetyltransferase 15/16, NatA auxiliary subunit